MTGICTGVLGRNCVAAAFAFSLVLVILGLIDSIPVVLYLKSAAESLFNEKPKNDDDDLGEEDPEKQQRHKGSGQKTK